MRRTPNGCLVRAFCLIWSAFWFLLWLSATVGLVPPHARAWGHSLMWFRTGALFAAWAGVFAWKALEPPRR